MATWRRTKRFRLDIWRTSPPSHLVLHDGRVVPELAAVVVVVAGADSDQGAVGDLLCNTNIDKVKRMKPNLREKNEE